MPKNGWKGSGAATQRISFYSAQESEELVETPKAVPKAKGLGAKSKAGGAPKKATPAKAVAEQIKAMSALLPKLASQMEELQKEQTMRDFILQQGLSPPTRPSQQPVTMQPSQFEELLGPPPRIKGLSLSSPPPLPVRRIAATPKIDSTVPVQEQMEEAAQADPQQNPLAMAVLEQSRALTSLVAHLQAGDPLLDSQATSSGNTSRGAVGREKLQKELANRSGGFLLAVTQNMFRRLRPASPLPQSLEEMKETDMSMLQYLELFGGYGNCKDMGVVQYPLLHSGHGCEEGHGGHPGTYRTAGGSYRPIRTGRRSLGIGVSASVGRRPTKPDVQLQEPCSHPDWQDESFLATVPATMGNDQYRLYQGIGFHPEPSTGDCKEGQPTSTSPTRCISEEEGEVSKRKGNIWRSGEGGSAGSLTGPLPSSSSSVRPAKHLGGTASFGRGTFGLSHDSSAGGAFKDQRIRLGKEADNVRPLHLPFACWPERYLKGSGTPFAHFVFRAFHCCRGVRRDAPPDALFPIPLPLDGAWGRIPDGLSKDRRLRLAYRRMVHLCVIALNFLHHRAPFSSLSTMRRCPGTKHVQVYARIMALCRACGPTDEVSILGCGRKSHQ